MLDESKVLAIHNSIKKANEVFEKDVSRINKALEIDLESSQKLKRTMVSYESESDISEIEDASVLKNAGVVLGVSTNSDEIDEDTKSLEGHSLELRPEDIEQAINSTKSGEEQNNIEESLTFLKAELKFCSDSLKNSLNEHIDTIKKWCSTVSFKELKGQRRLINSYIDLDSYLTPRDSQYCSSEKGDTKKLVTSVLTDSKHALVQGTPGAGKTTSMKKLASHVINEQPEKFESSLILIRFRALKSSSSKTPLLDAISRTLKCEILYNGDFKDRETVEELKLKVVSQVLNTAGFVLILEGYDEISENHVKSQVLVEIRKLAEALDSARMIVTCRTGEFSYEVDNFTRYEIAPLDSSQIEEFAEKWLGEDHERFISELKHTPYYDTAMRPLTLGHLCAIYERIKRVPDKPKTIYKKVVNLLLEEWDQQRSITRESNYAKFETDQKFEFLSNIAFELTSNGIRGEFSDAQLRDAYIAICENFGLSKSKSETDDVIQEIESHTGLFVRAGVDKFEFAHKSIQEYLTAEYLVRLPSLNFVDEEVIEELGAELAVATAISSHSSRYFSEVLLNIFPRNRLTFNFIQPFLNRLILEKPDLTLHKELALAVLYLMTSEICINDNLKDLFRKFLHVDNLNTLKQYYSYTSRNVKEKTITLSRCGDLKGYSLPFRLIIRDELELIYEVFNCSEDE